MAYSYLILNRLRVVGRNSVAYDQVFHQGVNIIRGQNGSGKTTIADFIFFALGGEFDDWKSEATRCDEVQAEISTPRGLLTLRRETSSSRAPMWIHFGNFEEAQTRALDSWERYPIRRQGNQISASQVLFRSMLIPEAQSEGASNVTMHQILRLLYADQRTPATRLFRYDQWDTQNIREAVGDLICGISGYEIYELDLQIRAIQKQLDDAKTALKSLMEVLPADDAINTPELIRSNVKSLQTRKSDMLMQIGQVDDYVKETTIKEFLDQRKALSDSLSKRRNRVSELEVRLSTADIEAKELRQYVDYLQEVLQKLGFAEATSQSIGSIEFSHCPACLTKVDPDVPIGICNVCGSDCNIESDRSKYNQIRLDIEIQMRESYQLLEEKNTEIRKGSQELRYQKQEYRKELSEFTLRFDLSSSPREAFLAERNNEIGKIDSEISYLNRRLDVAEKIRHLMDKKANLSSTLKATKTRRNALAESVESRRSSALQQISGHAAGLLRSDLPRQPEFARAQHVLLNFITDAIALDGEMNFAESSNVYLKNAAIFSIFLAAGYDDGFFHPRFLLFDNVEDKGMEPARSHRFQELIVRSATELAGFHQIIYTTSMMNPQLELDDYVIGPKYTHQERTLWQE